MSTTSTETRGLGSSANTPAHRAKVSNALTVDVEDYFQVRAFESVVPLESWSDFELRVESNTTRLLDMFDTFKTSATFFVLGWVAERCPNLVQEIHSRGHEVACHGHLHRSIKDLTDHEFREDIRRSKVALEGLTGSRVIGFRAPSFSIVGDTMWAIDALAEEGFEYDSSIFPIVHDHYGVPDAPRFPWLIRNSRDQRFYEFPISTVHIGRWNFPFSGGGYLRHFPFPFVRWAIRHLNEGERQPVMLYIHPWEIDAEQPRIRAPLLSRIRHYRNIDQTEKRLARLLADFDFTTVRKVLGL